MPLSNRYDKGILFWSNTDKKIVTKILTFLELINVFMITIFR